MFLIFIFLLGAARSSAPIVDVIIDILLWASEWPAGGRPRSASSGATSRVASADAEREALAGWLTPAQLALFDGMHRADQRHGLDVVASLRADGHATIPTCCSPGCSTTGQGTDVGLLAAGRLVARRALRPAVVRATRAGCPASATRYERLATTPTARPSWRWRRLLASRPPS